MPNWHEFSVLLVSQVALIFAVQNVYLIFYTYGKELEPSDNYFQDAANNPRRTDFYRFSNVESFYSAYLEFQTDGQDVEVFWIKHLMSIQLAGVFLGSLIFGALADYFGRKNVCRAVFFIGTALLAGEGFIHNSIVIAVARFFVGLLTGGVIVVTWSFTTELIQPQTRFLARAFANWPNARLILTIICYFTGNWRLTLHICAGIAFISFGFYCFFLPESPTWLFCQKRYDEAEKIRELIIQRSNGACDIKLPDRKPTKHLTFISIWQKSKYRNIMLLFGTVWILTNFTAAMIDYTEILGVTEIMFGIINRRNLHLVSLLISMVGMTIAAVMVTLKLNETYNVAYCFAFLTSLIFAEFVWDACYLCVIEQVPTEVRSTVCGTCSFFSRVFGIAATLMVYVKKEWAPAPLYTATIAMAIHFLIAFKFLKESKDADLSEVSLERM
ncbi:unnamed protein product [Caenorhabditis auriculariae]|uniref:Major facilitator superfamily (MFS) profile domain-containing protein n=1 Tax=Caenorhabditis auriculariae TaxID=2777116 RepID=A0A8S1GX31_9PELO|nr:unnamed protein product [Caenorhabditis auriculariae]